MADLPPAPSDAQILTHLESLLAAQLPNSAIYNFLLSDVRLTSASRGLVTARLVLTREHVPSSLISTGRRLINSAGGLHGAVSAAIVDWAGGMAIASYDLRARTGVSADIHVRYLSSAALGDEVEIVARADRVGGSLAFTSVEITKVVRSSSTDDKEKGKTLIASGTHTKFVRQRPPPPS